MPYINRITPALAPEHMKTYKIVRPNAPAYRRPVTCTEAQCATQASGWVTRIDETSELGKRQAHYVRNTSGRRYTETRDAALTTFSFAPGQECFAEHEEITDREPLYVVRDGDWRGNPRGTRARVHATAADWLDDFGTHQQTLADRLAQG